MKFVIDRIENVDVSDEEIFDLLFEVYVRGGFTTQEVAKAIFDPPKVKSRGVLFVSRESTTEELAGMVIVVPPDSPAVVKAKESECEMHLLGVLPKFRGRGIGRSLVDRALVFATDSGWSKMILWTQAPMQEAKSLYESTGFNRSGEMSKNGIAFLIYERNFT